MKGLWEGSQSTPPLSLGCTGSGSLQAQEAAVGVDWMDQLKTVLQIPAPTCVVERHGQAHVLSYNECGETLEQVAQRNCRCPMSGSVQS